MPGIEPLGTADSLLALKGYAARVKVLLADKLAESVPLALSALGAEPIAAKPSKDKPLAAILAQYDPEVLVVRSTKVTAAEVAAGKSLSLIVRAGAGVNTIDLDSASARGIYVANCPGKNAYAVAELTLLHLLNLDRRIVDGAVALREGRWEKSKFSGARGLHGRTLAVLGCGQIGRAVIERAQAFGMKVRAWSRSLDDAKAEQLGVERATTPIEAVRGADAVTVHLPLAEGTKHLCNDAFFGAMEDGAAFVNTSRAELVDAAALERAITSKKLRVGLDVFDAEPNADGAFGDPVAKHAHVYGTHHIGASTQQAEEAVGAEVVRIVVAYMNGDPIPNCVNLAQDTDATHRLVVRHADRVGVLAHVLTALGRAGHNVQDMQNIVFSGAEAAIARIAIVGAPSAETLAAINANEHVYAATVTAIA